MKIFASGSTGFVGGHLCAELLGRGHQLRLLTHQRQTSYVAGVEMIAGDVTRSESYVEALRGCDAVVNLVGIIREFPGRGITFDRLHVEAARAMVAAVRQSGVKRYLQMSALGARPGAISRYHQTKFQSEELVRASGLDFTIFRPSLIFGQGDAFVNMLAGYIRSYPAVPVIGDGRYQLQPISVDDVARCFAVALEMPETIGHTFELCGPDRFSYNELLDVIGRVLGKARVLKVPNPLGLMKLVVPLFQRFSFFPLTMDQLTMLTEGNVCGGEWRKTFGFEPEGFEAAIRRYLH
ncbi:complex I NDUFA9 subunit family protein [Geobacter argillaceus]|uniref:NADH dehydrogenase n=1 Tax=Geobacter argillaceus TaxID=345631 RepID=A0A562VJ66_9BACT|nr:complex I NDUFA9 subunit family protein [Geobacter argillaceus]TWJ18006.1 NADH dehydrogenase [Geobacter argillaceus]